VKDKPSHGGKRAGAGRKPAHEAPKEQRSVALSPRAWAFVALLALQLDCSENEAIERLIRSHPLFVPETEERNKS
jgi:hypothetical protein